MNSKHTPGPWFVRTCPNSKYPECPTFDILTPNPDAGKSGASYSGENLSVVFGIDCEADARLIAAAPCLLEALEATVEYLLANLPKGKIRDSAHFHALNLHACTVKQARAAIAKAKGEA